MTRFRFFFFFRELFSVRPSDVIFNAAPLTFDPSIVEIFLALSSGAKLVAVSNQIKVSPNRLISVLVEHRVTILQVRSKGHIFVIMYRLLCY